VQIVYSSRRGSRETEHSGSAHDTAELEVLKAAARQRMASGQQELGLGLDGPGPGGPLPITSSRMGCLLDALECAYQMHGFEDAACGDEVFRQLVLARIIELASKIDSIRVLEETRAAAASCHTIERRLPIYAHHGWRQRLSQAYAAHAKLGPASLVLYDVSTLLCRRRHNEIVTSYKITATFPLASVREAALCDLAAVAAAWQARFPRLNVP
jgi:hypothetical protein